MVSPSDDYRLLIADDDAGFRETLCAIFEPFFRLYEADSGEDAIRVVQANPMHLVLLDMHMATLTGLETVKILRQMHRQLPCILITANATEELREEATSAEAFEVLPKPVRRRDLVETVASALTDTYDDPGPLGDIKAG